MLKRTKGLISSSSSSSLQSLPSSDPPTRIKALRFLMSLPTITSSSAPRTSPTWLLSQIVSCCLSEPDGIPSHPYLFLIDDLETLTYHKPDFRYYLKLFQAHPHTTYEWARKSANERSINGSPNRLVDWLWAAWPVWKREFKSPELAVDTPEDLYLRDLGVKFAQTAVAQVPVSLKKRKVGCF